MGLYASNKGSKELVRMRVRVLFTAMQCRAGTVMAFFICFLSSCRSWGVCMCGSLGMQLPCLCGIPLPHMRRYGEYRTHECMAAFVCLLSSYRPSHFSWHHCGLMPRKFSPLVHIPLFCPLLPVDVYSRTQVSYLQKFPHSLTHTAFLPCSPGRCVFEHRTHCYRNSPLTAPLAHNSPFTQHSPFLSILCVSNTGFAAAKDAGATQASGRSARAHADNGELKIHGERHGKYGTGELFFPVF